MKSVIGRLALAAAVVASSPAVSAAQRVLHHAARDEQAKALAALVDALTSAGAIGAQLKNFEELAAQQIEITLRWQESRMRSTINGFTTWQDVADALDRVSEAIAPALDPSAAESLTRQRLQEIKARQAAIAKSLEQLRAEGKAKGLLDSFFAQLNDAKAVVDFAEGTVLKGNPAAVSSLNEAIATLQQIEKLIGTARAIVKAHQGVQVAAASLGPPPIATELELLKIEQRQLTALGLIRARAALETGALSGTLEQARSHLKSLGEPPDRLIETSLTELKTGGHRGRLEFAFLVLLEAGAITAQQTTAAELGWLRDTQVARRAAIERAGVIARTNETIVRTAAARLAAYWSAGFKPRDAAELLFNLSAALSLPIIAAK